jgi:outer membrane protein assembly factor BamC
METDWAENRAKLPQDIIRGTLGKLVDSVYSTGELDRFRTRLERTPNGTEIFISHRGMQEVYNNSSQDQTVWQPRPSDPELETEFLRRLMVKLGVSQEQSKILAATTRRPRPPPSPAWATSRCADQRRLRPRMAPRRPGARPHRLHRGRPRPQRRHYFVRYVTPNPDKKEPGFFGKLFSSSSKDEAPIKFRILVKSQGESTTVSVLNEAGAPETSANAQRIVQVIADDLK